MNFSFSQASVLQEIQHGWFLSHFLIFPSQLLQDFFYPVFNVFIEVPPMPPMGSDLASGISVLELAKTWGQLLVSSQQNPSLPLHYQNLTR